MKIKCQALDGEKIIEQYLTWLKDNMKFKNIKSNIVSIDSPFLDRHNDYIRIYIKKNKDNLFYLTDDGFSLYDLKISGVSFTEKQKKILEVFINGQGIKYNEKTGELYCESTWEDLPQKKNDLMQAILNVGDMFLVSTPYIKTLFFEEVAGFFKKKNIPATPDVFVEGRGYKNKIDFLIPSTKGGEEKIIKLVNRPGREIFQRLLFLFLDIKNGKTIHSNATQILFINNQDKNMTDVNLEAIRKYSVEPVLWTEREEKLTLFN
jgi:hypothetical protein